MKNTSKLFKVRYETDFVQIPNVVAQSTVLTPNEVSLLVNLVSRPHGWVFVKTSYWRLTNLGRDAFNTAWKGLTDKGYIKCTKLYENNLICGYDYTISVLPMEENVKITSVTENQLVRETTDESIGLTDRPITEKPESRMTSEHIKTDNINKEIIKKDFTVATSNTSELRVEKSFSNSLSEENYDELFDELFVNKKETVTDKPITSANSLDSLGNSDKKQFTSKDVVLQPHFTVDDFDKYFTGI